MTRLILLSVATLFTLGCGDGEPPVVRPDVSIDSAGCSALSSTDVLAGRWMEESQIDCTSGDFISGGGIGELNLTYGGGFGTQGRIEVTWMPFETYVDWWGSYVYVEEGGMLIDVEGGNYVPTDIDGEGCIALDGEGRLVLTGVWLGSPAPGGGTPNCGHRFVSF